ncbi:hypothetical protein [Saccharothrix syringae]|uniref:Uncharacterized protein n=1 Tax=Saccharothrix syringae TaxID=103733 RepID=A0A5Q0GWK4_SACSY|nr:hypothetical protein [Saccharothrix syringae]QFZ18496.1 hypothetical protein EKG83_14325 [Saccharothrix syringae]
MTPHDTPEIEIVVRRFTDNGCQVTAVVADPADAQQTLYGTVTRNGTLVGSYYCADRVRQSDWRIVTALGLPLELDRRPVTPVSESAAVQVLTTVLTARDSDEVEQRLRAAIRPLR